MKSSVLREFITEIVSASREYLSKENLRKQIQDKIVDLVSSKIIFDQKTLDKFLSNIDSETNSLAVTTLRSIPFRVWKKFSSTGR